GVYDLRYADRGSNLRSKGADGFTPLGPDYLSADSLDPRQLELTTWVNGAVAQHAVLDDNCCSSSATLSPISPGCSPSSPATSSSPERRPARRSCNREASGRGHPTRGCPRRVGPGRAQRRHD